MRGPHLVLTSLSALPLAVAVGCFDCDLVALTAETVGPDATACSPEGATREDVDWPCLYAAIEDGYPAWVVWEHDDGPPEVPFTPRTLASGISYDGVQFGYSLRHLDRCDELDHHGPCVTIQQVEPTGDFNEDPSVPDGPGRINIEDPDEEESIHCS